MVAVPAWVWRFGVVVRAWIVGAAVGIVVGLLARRDIGDPRLAPGVIEYSRGLRDAADRRLWWLIVVLGVVALGTAVLETITGPIREVVVSWLYFAFFPIEA
jgi:hypothetical protein